jgi:hypothetical protein
VHPAQAGHWFLIGCIVAAVLLPIASLIPVGLALRDLGERVEKLGSAAPGIDQDRVNAALERIECDAAQVGGLLERARRALSSIGAGT